MSDPPPPRESDFHVAVIFALGLEGNAVDRFFDHVWEPEELEFLQKENSPNDLRVGLMGHHHIVSAWMYGPGKSDATSAAKTVKQTFHNIKLVLVVGICAAIPSIPFGDTIFGLEILPYDIGKELDDGFLQTHPVIKLDPDFGGFFPKLKSDYDTIALKKAAHDHFKAKFLDAQDPKSKPKIQKPNVHFGLVASGDRVIRAAQFRDRIATGNGDNPIGFEMEAAGVEKVYHGRVLVIKGVCDHADKDKTKAFQKVAAKSAAAYMRAFLDRWQPPTRKQSIFEGMASGLHEVARGPKAAASDSPVGGETGPEPSNLSVNSPAEVKTEPEPSKEEAKSTGEVGLPATGNTREATAEQEGIASNASDLTKLSLDTSVPKTPNCKECMNPHDPSQTLSRVSTFMGSPRGVVEEVQDDPGSLPSDKESKAPQVSETEDKSKSPETAELFTACEQRNVKRVKELLQTGKADPSATNSNGKSMLCFAIGTAKVDAEPETMQNIADIVKELCVAGASVNDIDRSGLGPIHLCVKTMNIKAAKCLLDRGVNIDLLDKEKHTPLDYMAVDRYPDVKFAEMLVKKHHARLGSVEFSRLKVTNSKQGKVKLLLKGVKKAY